MKDPYEILGINQNATDDEIKKAYRAASRKYHPDANPQNPRAAEEKFKEVQQAYKEIVRRRSEGASAKSGETQGSYYGQRNQGYGGRQEEDPFWGWGFGGFGGFGGGQPERPKAVIYNTDSTQLRAAANYINAGCYQDALRLLNSIDYKNARWYYFSAMANSGAGNNILAKQQISQALSMDAGNGDYRLFQQYLNGNSEWYQTKQGYYG